MAPSTKKRKANALDDDTKPIKTEKSVKTENDTNPVNPEKLEDDTNAEENGHNTSNASHTMPEEESYDIVSGFADVPFTLSCPHRPNKRKSKGPEEQEVTHPATEDGGFKDLTITYSVRPGRYGAWTDLKAYRNFIVGEHKFSLGSIVYINRHSPAPPPPPQNASEAALLAYDRQNLWVAKVLEVRALDTARVYLRVFWLYWPEELPTGRQAYHGENEFVMSNAMEIIDAMTVAGPAEVKQWDEQDDEQDDLGQRFFRQFLDIKKLGKKVDGLSQIRMHCICRGYYNPDKTMYKCENNGCGMWNHEECLVAAVLEKTYKRLVEDSGPAANGAEATGGSNSKEPTKPFPVDKLKDLKKSQSSSALNVSEAATPKSTAKAKKKAGGKGSWKGKFSAKITNGDESTGKGVKATITDERGQDPETWTENIECLKCGNVLD